MWAVGAVSVLNLVLAVLCRDSYGRQLQMAARYVSGQSGGRDGLFGLSSMLALLSYVVIAVVAAITASAAS